MQQKQEEELPRFIKDFIGKGHELESKKKERRKVELEERSLANRVLFLQKQQIKAQKAIQLKKQELSRIMNIAQRQAYQKEEKERLEAQREKQIQLAKQENRMRRIIHMRNKQQSLQTALERNSLDYKIAKKIAEESQKRKELNKIEDLTSRKERYMTLNRMKEKGKSRIDKYFKKKNAQHTSLYKQKISLEEGNTKGKLQTIKQLAQIQTLLRRRLEESSLRVSQMQQIIGEVSSSVKKGRLSRTSFNLNTSGHQSPALITAVQGELSGTRQQIEQRIQEGVEGASEGRSFSLRRRNKHANRYKQYQQF